MAGRIADAVVTAGTWPGRSPAVVVVDAAGGGFTNADADADARPRVARSVRFTASGVVTESVGVAAFVGVVAVVPRSGGLPYEKGSNGRLGRSCDTRYGTRGPGSRADRNA